MLLVGTNNHGHTPEMIASGIMAIVDLLREKQPQAHVVVMVTDTVNHLVINYGIALLNWLM